jgi:serine/threonine-protein kinase
VGIVDRALAPDPGDRYRDGSAMAEALREAREVLAGEPGATEAMWTAPTAATSANGGVAAGSGPDEDMAGRPSGPAGTRVAPLGPAPVPSTRRAPRRARIGAVVIALGVAIAGLAAVLLGGGGRTVVPELLGLPRGGVVARAQREHVRPSFTTAYSVSRAGIAIAQDPGAGTSVGDGATVRVVLSKGPPPVSVPGVLGLGISAARSRLGAVGLHTRTALVPGGGRTPGTVVGQAPSTGSLAAAGSTVSLSVAQTPRWHPVTGFAGTGDASSVAFRIRGARWEVTYSMDYQGTCTLLIVCFGPSATARSVTTSSTVGTFDLSKGSGHAHVFETGPGVYVVGVSAGHDAARWSMRVRDYY